MRAMTELRAFGTPHDSFLAGVDAQAPKQSAYSDVLSPGTLLEGVLVYSASLFPRILVHQSTAFLLYSCCACLLENVTGVFYRLFIELPHV